MNWKELWMTLFGTTEWLGLNIGFWVAMAVVLLIVIVMNVVFWTMKPKADAKNLILSTNIDNTTARKILPYPPHMPDMANLLLLG